MPVVRRASRRAELIGRRTGVGVATAGAVVVHAAASAKDDWMTRSVIIAAEGNNGANVAEYIGRSSRAPRFRWYSEDSAAAAGFLADDRKSPSLVLTSTPCIGRPTSTIRASEPRARANSAFCWLPPESDRMALRTSGVRMPMRFCHRRQLCSRSARNHSRSARERAHAEAFWAIDHCGKMPSAWRSPGDEGHGGVDRDAGHAVVGSVETHRAAAGLARVPARPARPMIAPGRDQLLAAARRCRGRQRDHDRGVRARGSVSLTLTARGLAATGGGDQPVAVESSGLVADDDLAAAHHDDAALEVEDFAEQVRDEMEDIRARRCGVSAARNCWRCAHRAMRSARRGYPDAAAHRLLYSEGARHFHHLAAAER